MFLWWGASAHTVREQFEENKNFEAYPNFAKGTTASAVGALSFESWSYLIRHYNITTMIRLVEQGIRAITTALQGGLERTLLSFSVQIYRSFYPTLSDE